MIVLEPHPSNYSQALKNTKRFKNVSAQNLAIGDSCGRAEFEDPGLGNDAYRANFTADTGSVQVVDVDEILKQNSEPSFAPFILKCDIEGSEKQLFSSNTDWIARCNVLIIELHDWLFPEKETSKNFLRTISQMNGDFVHHGENTFFIQRPAFEDLKE